MQVFVTSRAERNFELKLEAKRLLCLLFLTYDKIRRRSLASTYPLQHKVYINATLKQNPQKETICSSMVSRKRVKTPKKEIEKAMRLKVEYFEEK
jgi:hypothetical protein